MSSAKADAQDSQIFFCDDGGRAPQIDRPDQTGDIYVNDWVRFSDGSRQGRFKVTAVIDGKYKLKDEQGVSLENGKMFEESELELED